MRDWLARGPLRRLLDPPPRVNVVRLNGVIGRVGPVGAGMTLAGLERNLARAFSGRNLKAVALAVNSPGGSPVQSALIAGRIRQLAEEKGLPVLAFAEDVAASGGYWLACAGDEIFANENSIVGSIGVISTSFGFPEVLARFGIERRVHAAGEHKGMFDPFRPEQPSDVARLTSIQTDMHDSFKRMVRDRRKDKLTASDETLFEGDIWTGAQALPLGLIDGLGDAHTVLRARFGEKVHIVQISTRINPVRRWLGRGGREQAAYAHVAGTIGALEDWAHWKRLGL
ncbi:MAG: S49 family peptidase [Alphaproteobacteria bacterium]